MRKKFKYYLPDLPPLDELDPDDMPPPPLENDELDDGLKPELGLE